VPSHTTSPLRPLPLTSVKIIVPASVAVPVATSTVRAASAYISTTISNELLELESMLELELLELESMLELEVLELLEEVELEEELELLD